MGDETVPEKRTQPKAVPGPLTSTRPARTNARAEGLGHPWVRVLRIQALPRLVREAQMQMEAPVRGR
jgi:hypothetical protein